jgi:hypothetical protein
MPTVGPDCAMAFESETEVDEAIGLARRWWTAIGDHGTGGRVSGNSQEAGSGDA